MISTFPLSRVKPVHASLESSSDEDTPIKKRKLYSAPAAPTPPKVLGIPPFRQQQPQQQQQQQRQQQQSESPRTLVGSGMGSYPSTLLVSRRDHTRRMLEGNFINSLN